VKLRREMRAFVRRLRAAGATIDVTTLHQGAQEMDDRIGVIRGGELVVVEQKARLTKTLGKKQLRLQLVRPLEAVPPGLAGWARLTASVSCGDVSPIARPHRSVHSGS
jgi:ABC-2 type transport system ATP-binding protein